jgi:cell wall-associated NlpC family hydrolase
MNDDADAAARVIERLLVDPNFRADFRRDPATACRDAGLDDLADYMGQGAGKAMHTLEIRESRSSLAGVMMAAALEGIGVFEFARHIVPGAIAAPGAARDVLSRVNLPKIDGAMALRGSLAQPPDVPAGGGGAEDAAADNGAPGASTPGANAPGAGAPVSVAPQPPPTTTPAPEPEPGGATASDTPADAAPAKADAPAVKPDVAPASATPAENVRYPHADAIEPASPAAPPVDPQGGAAPPAPQAAGAPVDPAQFGAEGTGGAPSSESSALLENKNVVFDRDGVADIKAGRIDPRVVAVLTKLSADHKITVSCMCSDHPTFTTGGSVSNHHHGRGVDIAAIDGVPVNAGNPIARDIATELSSLDPNYRPDEIGTPWAINGPGYFTDADHSDHLHVGFKQAIDPSWTPPADQAAGSAAPPGAPAPAPAAAPAAPAGGGTLSIPIPNDAGARKASAGTLGLRVPAAGGATPVAQSAGQPGASAGAVADLLPPGGTMDPGAGAKAVAALDEAMKYKGTDYLWGGSNPKTGFDCSGLVQWAYAKQGIEIPRVTDQQILAANGTKVDRKALVAGDLVFFRDPSGYVHHVGISMGGDKFLHAPHTGDVVKVSSLDEPYYAQQFAGGRRFDETPAGAPGATPPPAAVDAASAALDRDAAAARSPNSMIFKALSKQEASHHSSTVQFMRAIRPEDAPQFQRVAAAAVVDAASVPGSVTYPGDGATKEQFAAWLAARAQKAGLPPELPVMASLVESGLANLGGGDADSVGFFQMRVGIWNQGAYAGYPKDPELQAKWFIDHALEVKKARIAAGDANFGKDPSAWGNWIADIERPAEQYRGRYQLRLEEARGLLAPKV